MLKLFLDFCAERELRTDASASSLQMLQRRFLCTQVYKAADHHPDWRRRRWRVKQVTKSNFTGTLEEIKDHIFNSDFIAVSLQKTGSYSSPWHRIQPFDTDETAYFKAKYAAERFQLLQFAVCPFSIRASKLIANPYNFHLFPRDELKMGMPSYSFSCQSSYLTSMAREGFDFNTCIYDGISYLSKAQESEAKVRMGSQVSSNHEMQSSSSHSVADTVFIQRIKSRVGHWIDTFKPSHTRSEDALVISLRKLISGNEEYGSRPSLSIDVCSERQVLLVIEMLKGLSDTIVPLIIPAKGGGSQAVQVVLTSSKEDKDLFEKELQNKEDEQNRRIRGFREVIDLISSSQKPVVAQKSLNEFAFIHSKFLSPLPSTVNEFMSSLSSVFPNVLDVNHLMKETPPLKKVKTIPASISQLQKRPVFAPIDVEIPQKADAEQGKSHGYTVLRITNLFAKLCSTSEVTPENVSNIFTPRFSPTSQESMDGDLRFWAHSEIKVSRENLVFLWGFRRGITAEMLKNMLRGSNEAFFEEDKFDLRLVDKSCALVVFWNAGLAETFIQAMDSGGFSSESLRDMISEGLRTSGYGIYNKACELGIWETYLSDSLDNAMEE